MRIPASGSVPAAIANGALPRPGAMTGAAVLAGLFVLYAMFASRLERLWISAPMVFVIAGVVFGRHGLDLVRDPLNVEPVRAVTEVTLALLLFADASTISLHEVEADGGVPTRLLLIGLPLTMVLGTLMGMALFPSAGWATMALIAVILAPTDAALGLAVVTNPVVPVRVRRVLNVESGLNDGIATPFVTWLLALVAADEHVGRGTGRCTRSRRSGSPSWWRSRWASAVAG